MPSDQRVLAFSLVKAPASLSMVRRRSTVRFREGAPFQQYPNRGGVAQGQSRRLIIAESVVRVHPPLLTRCVTDADA